MKTSNLDNHKNNSSINIDGANIDSTIDNPVNTARLKQITEPLLHWYGINARKLPWRENTEGYRIWVSEIMLQQTRVEAGLGYFIRFMEALPSIEALANVSDDRLMKLWEGLGYYSRARNLKKAAGIVMEQYGGRLPNTYEELLKLPGIGPYTAGAVGSIAYGLPVPAVDGNVLRVVSRVLGSRKDIGSPAVKKEMEKGLRAVIPQKCPGDFNQALMELGAVVCIPNGEPKCTSCPLSKLCVANKQNLQKEIPVKVPKKPRRIEEKTVFVVRKGDYGLLHKRGDKGLLSGLWELPNLPGILTESEAEAQCEKLLGIKIKQMRKIGEAKHVFSHVEWHMTGWLVEAEKESLSEGGLLIKTGEQLLQEEKAIYSKDTEKKPAQWIWVDSDDLERRFALPSAFSAFRQEMP